MKEFVLAQDKDIYDHFHLLNHQQKQALKETDDKVEQMDQMLLEHEQNFVNDEQEPKEMSPDEMEKLGYYYKYGIMFDKDDKLIKMTKK